MEFLNVKSSDKITPNGGLSRSTILIYSLLAQLILLSFIAYFTAAELAKEIYETTIEATDMTDPATSKACKPLVKSTPGSWTEGPNELRNTALWSGYSALTNDNDGAGLSFGSTHCMKATKGICEAIEEDWLTPGKWQYGTEFSQAYQTCKPNTGPGDEVSDQWYNDYHCWMYFDISKEKLDIRKVVGYPEGESAEHPFGDNTETLTYSSTVLFVTMPYINLDNYDGWPGGPNIPWTAATKNDNFLADCEAIRPKLCENIEAASAPFACTTVSHPTFVAAWGAGFATGGSISIFLFPLVTMFAIKVHGKSNAKTVDGGKANKKDTGKTTAEII